MFGNTIDEIKKKWNEFIDNIEEHGLFGENGAFASLFSGKKAINILTPEVLSQFDKFKEKFNSSSLSAEALAEQMENIDQRIIDYAKTCKNGEMTTEGFKASINGMSLSAKAATVTLKVLSIAGNMLAVWAITKVVSLVATGIDNLVHSAEHCKERVDELMTNYQSAIDKAKSNAKNVEELASKYEELSKGVNNLGENVSLATDEYTEYNKIVNQIADMFPTLIQGYNNEGNAILSLKGNVEKLRDAYKEAQQEAYNLLIADGKDSNGNDIIANYQNQVNGENIPWFLRKNVFVESRKDGAKESIEIIKKLTDTSSLREFLDVYSDLFEEYSNVWSDKDISTLSNTLQSLGIEDVLALSKEDFENIKRSAQTAIRTYQAEIDLALKDVKLLANAYLMTSEDYEALNEQSKSVVSIIVNGINEDIANGFENKIAVGLYANKILDTIKDNINLQDALYDFSTLDYSSLSVNDAILQIDSYISAIADAINLTPLESKFVENLGLDDIEISELKFKKAFGMNLADFKSLFGFDDVDDTAHRLQNTVRALADDHGMEIREIINSDEYAELVEIINNLKFNEAELCLNAINDAENVTDALNGVKEVLESISDAEEPKNLSAKLTSSADSLDKFQSSVKAAADAYATLLSGNYSSTELLDSIQAINQAAKDMGSSINWEDIDLKDIDSLDLLGNKLEEVSQKYAESILSGAGIDDSEFSQILTDIISQTYEAEAEFTGMNAQLDNLQSSYQTLTGILESYNETGHISLDNLQSLLTADENLISMLEIENGQLVINQAAYENLVAAQLLEFRAKLDDAAAAEIEALAHNKSEEATNNNAKASEDAVAKLDAETEAFKRNTEAAGENAITKAIADAEEAGVSEEEIQSVLDKYTAIWNAAKDNYSTDFPSFMSGAKSGASSAGEAAGKSAGEAFTDALDKELAALDKNLEAGYIDFNDYIQARLALIEDYYDQGKLSADEYYSYLEKHYNMQLSYMDKAVNAVTRRIDAELDALKQQKEDVENIYRVRIESLEKEKTLLEETNKERQRQKDLQKSLYDLERAKNQRTQLVYSEDRGMIYVADDQSIRDAQESVDNAGYDIKISEIEKSISNLEEARDKETNAIDEMISDLEAYKNAWNDVTSAYEEEQENLIAAQILGADWEADILSGRLDVLNDFKNQYIRIQQEMAAAAWESANEQAKAAQEAEKGSLGSNKLSYVNLQAYGSGTNNAKKGLNLVGEDGPEAYFDNHVHVAIVAKPTLIPMEGGEVVKNERDTEKLLDPDNLAPVDTIEPADIDGKETNNRCNAM